MYAASHHSGRVSPDRLVEVVFLPFFIDRGAKPRFCGLCTPLRFAHCFWCMRQVHTSRLDCFCRGRSKLSTGRSQQSLLRRERGSGVGAAGDDGNVSATLMKVGEAAARVLRAACHFAQTPGARAARRTSMECTPYSADTPNDIKSRADILLLTLHSPTLHLHLHQQNHNQQQDSKNEPYLSSPRQPWQ